MIADNVCILALGENGNLLLYDIEVFACMCRKELQHKMKSKRLTEAVQRNTFHADLFLATAGLPDRNQTVLLCIL